MWPAARALPRPVVAILNLSISNLKHLCEERVHKTSDDGCLLKRFENHSVFFLEIKIISG